MDVVALWAGVARAPPIFRLGTGKLVSGSPFSAKEKGLITEGPSNFFSVTTPLHKPLQVCSKTTLR